MSLVPIELISCLYFVNLYPAHKMAAFICQFKNKDLKSCSLFCLINTICYKFPKIGECPTTIIFLSEYRDVLQMRYYILGHLLSFISSLKGNGYLHIYTRQDDGHFVNPTSCNQSSKWQLMIDLTCWIVRNRPVFSSVLL